MGRARGHSAAVATMSAARRTSMKLWRRAEDGSAQVELEDVAIGESYDRSYARSLELKALGVEVMMRPASEDAASVTALFAEHDSHRKIARERAGEGGDVAVSQYGMQNFPVEDVPVGVVDTIVQFGPSERGDEEVEAFWAHQAEPTDCLPHALLRTGQQHLSPTAIKEAPESGNSDFEPPHIIRIAGNDWIVDGHHRIARARQAGASIPVLRCDYEQAVADGWFDAMQSDDEYISS